MSFHRINCCKKDDLNCDAFVPGANAEPVGGKVCGVSPELATFNFKSIILADLMHSSVSGKYHTVTLDKGPFSVLVNNGTSGTHDYNVVIGSMKVYTDAAGTTLDATVDVSARVYIKNDASQMKLVIKATYSSHDYFLFAAAYGYNNINFGGWIFGCPTMDTEIVDGAFSDVDGASEVGAAADILLRLCGACSSPDMWLFKFSGLRPYCSADTTTLVSNFDDVVNGKTFACVANPFVHSSFSWAITGL